MKINQFINATPSFQVLSEDQIERISFSALDVLERTGVRLPSRDYLGLIGDSRVRSTGAENLRFPTSLVKEALRSHPERISVSGRVGRLRLQKNEVHFGAGLSGPVLCGHDGTRRGVTEDDVLQAARLVDALPGMDFCLAPGGGAEGFSSGLTESRAFLAAVRGCAKPLLSRSADSRSLEQRWRMAARLRGKEELALSPMFLELLEPETPLCPPAAVLEKLVLCAGKGIPCVYAPRLQCGVNAPLSLAGALVLGLAECFAGSVLASLLAGPGLPLVLGPRFGLAGRADEHPSLASPETLLMQAAFSDIAKWHHLPAMVLAGLSDAKAIDQQAAVEMGSGLSYAFLSGAPMVCGIGDLDGGQSPYLGGMVLGNEIIGMVAQIGKGISTQEDALALDLIEEIGPGGEYLTTEHTLEHFRSWFRPRLQDRSDIETWRQAGSRTMAERIREETERILAEHSPEPLDPGALEALEAEAGE